ncbi:MAG: hypothetical protein FWH47_06585, partial [Methanomassiliicoccaceae archaeon]|nr:hypothetical protein [Methanomassiliicoccaceae archaeon]
PEQDAPEKAAAAAPAMDPPFEAVWPADKKDVRLIEDGVKVRVEYSDAGPKPRLLFIFALPDVPDRIFHQAVNTSPFYLREKARCMAYAADPSSVVFAHDKKDRVWLSWDAERGAMVVSDTFDEPGVKDGLFDTKKSDVPPWSISFLTMAVGLLAQDGDAVYFAPRMLWELVHKGMVDDRGVRAAMLTLLQSPAVSPAKLMRPLEKDVRLLHVLWPMLTESIKAAGAETAADGGPPPWANRVLDTAVRYAPYLAEAARRGLIPAEDARWAGLSDIASSKSKSTAIGKSKELQALLG